MKQSTAIHQLNHFDQLGRYVFNMADLKKLFPEGNMRTFQAGLGRLVKSGILVRATKGVYVYALSRHKGIDTLEMVARTMRRGEYSYVSLESALSMYGVISQIPMDRLTIMTTGRKGEYKTPFGTIEFTHTRRSVVDTVNQTYQSDRPLRMASKQAAWRDLKRVGRNIHLIDESTLHED